jgi:uncharacterized damage-inducible protein DinB
MIKQLLLTELDYTAWANRQILTACEPLTTKEFNRDFGASFQSIAGTLRHIFYAERSWIHRLVINALPPMIQMADPRFDPNPPIELDYTHLVQAWPPVWSSGRQWLEETAEQDLDHELTSPLPDGSEFLISRWKILQHMINHSTLHRGQVMTMLRQLGQRVPSTDIFTFYMVEAGAI